MLNKCLIVCLISATPFPQHVHSYDDCALVLCYDAMLTTCRGGEQQAIPGSTWRVSDRPSVNGSLGMKPPEEGVIIWFIYNIIFSIF